MHRNEQDVVLQINATKPLRRKAWLLSLRPCAFEVILDQPCPTHRESSGNHSSMDCKHQSGKNIPNDHTPYEAIDIQE
jgi:hypothetical protein